LVDVLSMLLTLSFGGCFVCAFDPVFWWMCCMYCWWMCCLYCCPCLLVDVYMFFCPCLLVDVLSVH
jgi:hypothetical protein